MSSRAYTVQDVLSSKFKTLPWGNAWADAFSYPEDSGVWFIWGQSGNGKTSLIVQLIVELSNYYRVFCNTLEEGVGLTLQEKLITSLDGGNTRNMLFGMESIEELDRRLSRRRAPHVAFIDSVQQSGITNRQFKELRLRHRNKLLVFVSQARGRMPSGKVADSIRYTADLKIFVEGYTAISNGRYNPGGRYTIWEDGAAKYWGDNKETQKETT